MSKQDKNQEEKKNLTKFRKPLDANEITWKVQGTTKDGSKTIIVPYMDNRAVMSRLDKCFGPPNWKTQFEHTNYRLSDSKDTSFGLGCICKLSIKMKGKWVTKVDGADSTRIESFKGSISDAMKRAATQFGMGRDLYEYPKVFIKGEHKYIPSEIEKKLNQLVQDYKSGNINTPVKVYDNPKASNTAYKQNNQQNSTNTNNNNSSGNNKIPCPNCPNGYYNPNNYDQCYNCNKN